MRNIFEVRGDVTAILLNSPKYGQIETMISTAKLDKAETFPNTWVPQWNVTTQSFYAVGTIGGRLDRKRYLLHRFITDAEQGFDVDHKNNITLDNTDNNIRILTRSENLQNRRRINPNNKSGTRNVSWCEQDQRWRVFFIVKRKQIFIGQYRELEEAKRIAEEARLIYMPYAKEASLMKGAFSI